ncbi:hypothetical protein [Microbaculum marinum]|uniref:Uncharacterized protein n=1 Tax=Microbaculum marinum TaxID=1764581 RepID=A0AAW9RX59_9HYPH
MQQTTIALIGFYVIIAIMLGFAAMVLLKIINGTIDLDGLVSEPINPQHPQFTGKASLSRFQFLIFTFVIAGLYLLLRIEHGTFVDIPETVLGLLGISGGSFVVSKAVGNMEGASPKTPANTPVAPPSPTAGGTGSPAGGPQ